MSGIANPSQLQNARIVISTRVRDAYNAVPDNLLWYKLLAEEIPSTSDAQAYFIEHMLPRMRKWVGSRLVRGLKREAVTVVNENYEETIGIPVNDVEDDRYDPYRSSMDALGRAGALWLNDLVYSAIINGGTTTWIDGQPFFHGSHPLTLQDGLSTTQSNLHTSMSLTAANFGTVRARMRALKGEDNQPLGVARGNKLILAVPQELEDTAKRIVNADTVGYLSNSSSTASDSNIYKDAADVLVLPELSADSATTWYVFDAMAPMKPFGVQVRQRPDSVVVLNRPTDPNVFSEDVVLFGTKGRGAPVYGVWQCAAKCTA
jgi:phage major head subunit gpT-like protein